MRLLELVGLILDEDVDGLIILLVQFEVLEVLRQMLLLLHEVVQAALDLPQGHDDVVVRIFIDAQQLESI